jgi:hypothetical protein
MLGSASKAVHLVTVAHAELKPEVLLPAFVLPEVVRGQVHAVNCAPKLLDGVALGEARLDCAPLFACRFRLRVRSRVLQAVVSEDRQDV